MTHDLEPAANAEKPDTASSQANEPRPHPAPEEIPTRDLVPGWLAALVLVLLLAFVGLGVFVARGLLMDPRPDSPEHLEIETWKAEVESNPEDLQARLALGYAYQQADRLDEALKQYEAVLEVVPTDTAALYNTGIIYLRLERPSAAEERFWDVLEVNPEHVLAAKSLGEYYAGREHYRSLIDAVEPAAEANESSADLHYLLGLAHENLNDPVLAETRYRNALKYYPDMAEALEGLERLGIEP